MSALSTMRKTRRAMYRGQSCLGTLIAIFAGRPLKRAVNIGLGRKLHSKGWWR